MLTARAAYGQRATLGPAVRPFIAVDKADVALIHARLIDGTGAPPKDDQTILIHDGRIAAIDRSAAMRVPAGAMIIDLTGKSVTPGLVMVHEHLHYPTGADTYGNVAESFSRLYLAGGVTSMRTAGAVNGFGEFELKKAIDAGAHVGPWMDVTGPYLEGSPGLGLNQFHELESAADARRQIDYWARVGATSVKAFMHITRDELRAAIAEAHARGQKVTGHLCSVTYREAAELGIDNIEHGFFAATDFVSGKEPDTCPDQGAALQSIAAIDPAGERMQSLIRRLIASHVALTSTPTVLETFTPGRPLPPGIDVLDPLLRDEFLRRKAAIDGDTTSMFRTLYAKLTRLDVDFFRAGGLLLAGTDPTGIGGVVAGYADQRALELLVEAGLTPLEAIKVATLNGATFLGRGDIVGSIVAGKQADLVIVAGDPSTRIEDIRNVTLVFKQGVGYDPKKLVASVRGRVGLF